MNKLAFIRKLPNGKYRVFSEKGKNMGTYDSHEQAKKRLGQIEYFKHNNADDKPSMTFSSILRKLRKLDEKLFLKFLKEYKKYFDKALILQEEKPEDKALSKSIKWLRDLKNKKSLQEIMEKLNV